MKTLSLYRDAEIGDCTIGRMLDDKGVLICATLEEKWVDKDNDGKGDKNVSRIPPGTYKGYHRLSPARGIVVPELKDVPGRGNIQIHVGNTTTDTLGCILVGTATAPGEARISGSKAAFAKLMAYLNREDFAITVHDIAQVKAA